MDLLLFERYGLNINENNINVISDALEKSKAESKWEKNLKAKNDKILSKAKAEQARWNEDKEILLNNSARADAAREISKTIEAIVTYVDQHIKDEDRFENTVSAFIEWDLKADDIRNIYEKYKAQFSTVVDPEKVKELKRLSRELVKSYGGFINIKKSIDDNIFSKFYEAGVDLTDFASALKLDTCANHYDIIQRSEAISSVAYDIYNRKLIKDSVKNAFMEVFSTNSNSANGLVKTLNDPWIEELSFANWAVVKEINLTCKLMDSETITFDSIQDLPADRQQNFAKAMKKLFGIKTEGSLDSASSSGRSASKGNTLPSEIRLGETELKKSDFQKASSYFNEAINKNPYCWQGYWGMFKAKVRATNDEEIYFPGFTDLLKLKKRGKHVDETVEYYVRAKEIAIAQQDTSINFFEIEKNYKIADKKAVQFIEYRDSLSQAYNSINETAIPNKGFSKFINEFREKSKGYKKLAKIVETDFVDYLIFLLLGVCFIAGGLGRAFGVTMQDISIFAGIIAGGIFGWSCEHTIIGVVVSFILTYMLNNGLRSSDNFFIHLLAVLAGVGAVAYMVHKILSKHRAKPEFEKEKVEMRNYLEENLVKCYVEDLSEYIDKNNMKSYGISIGDDSLKMIDLTKYLEIMGEVQLNYNFNS